MAYVGRTPTQVPLTSADIEDNIITSAKIVDGTIVNADINASSAIALSKLSTTGTASSSNFLRGDGAWTAISLSGTIVSTNEAVDTTQRSTTSSSFVDLSSNLSITITPSSSSNKFLILTDLWCRGDGNETYTTIYRGATNLGDSSRGLTVNPINEDYIRSPLLYLDSPATTSSITYKLYFKCEETTFRLNYDANSRPRKSRMIILEIKG